MGDTTSLVPGYPIRTSSDPCSVDSSPRHIADSHVLHRLSMPRHPPCALKHLQTQKPTIKNQKLHISTNTPPLQGQRIHQDARNHYPITKHHTPPPRWSDNTRCCLRTQQCARQLRVSTKDNCCCAPDRRHYSARSLHGLRPAQCRHSLRGAP